MSAIQHNDVFDFDGYFKKLHDLEAETQDFANSSAEAAKRIKSAYHEVKQELAEIERKLKAFNLVPNGAIPKLKEFEDEIEKTGKQAQATRDAIDSLTDANKANELSVKELDLVLKQLKKDYDALKPGQADYAAKQQEIINKTKIAGQVIDGQNAALKEARKSVNTVTNSYNELSRKTAEMRKELNNMSGAYDLNTGKINKNNRAAVEMQKQIDKNDRVLKKMDASVGVHTRNVGHYQLALQGLVGGGLQGMLMSLGLVGAAAAALINPFQAAVRVMENMDRMDSGLKAALGSQEAFERGQSFLVKTSLSLGLNYESLAKSYKGLAAATRNTSLEGKSTEQIFLGISKAGAALQLSNEEVEGSLYAISQMVSKGTVSMEELRQQLGERLPGAMRLLAEGMGISQGELNKLVESGQLMATEVLPKLASQLDKTYGADAQKNLDTMGGQWNNLTTTVQLFLKALNEDKAVTGFFARMMGGLSGVLKKWGELRAVGGGFGTMIGAKVDGLFGGVGADSERMRAAENRTRIMDTYSQATPLYQQKVIQKLNDELNAARKKLMTDVSGAEQAGLQVRIDTTKKLIDELRGLTASNRRQERREAEAHDKALAVEKADRDKKAAEKAGKDKEKQDKKDEAARRKRIAAENAALSSQLQVAREKTGTNINRVGIDKESGELDDSAALKKTYQARIEGAYAQMRLIKKAGKENSQEFRDDFLKAQKEVADAQQDYLREVNKLESAKWDKTIQVTRDALKQIDSDSKDRLTEQLGTLDAAYEEQRGKIEANVKLRKISEEEGERQIYDLRIKYLQDTQKAVEASALADKTASLSLIDGKIADLEAWRDSAGRTAKQVSEANLQIADLERLRQKEIDDEKLARTKANAEQEKKTAKDKSDYEIAQAQRAAQMQAQIQQAAIDTYRQAVEGYFEFLSGNREHDLEMLETQKSNELALAGDNEEAKAKIEEDFMKKQREIKRKQAIADRAAALFNIYMNMGMGIMSVLSTGGGTRYADFGVSAGILSGFVAAQGALQAGLILSKPLPAYKMGKDASDPYTGWAIAGEAGAEIHVQNGKATLVDKPSLIYTQVGDTIFPANETAQIMSGLQESRQWREAGEQLQQAHLQFLASSGLDEQAIERAFDKSLVKAFASQPIHQTIYDRDGIHSRIIENGNKTTHLHTNKFTS
ncbi:tape measure protein [Tellurirhabdus bombi]|uniref:tape measure protein n=1 Tax=Tellurirhabdus bombi TaxID=2907205 RepID=UPI001F1A0149|nr:tape measure protein [Tellurirhabdus bombi]